MYSLACKKLEKKKITRDTLIETSLKFGMYFGQSTFKSLGRYRIYRLSLLLNPNNQKIHSNLMQASCYRSISRFDHLTINQPLCGRAGNLRLKCYTDHQYFLLSVHFSFE